MSLAYYDALFSGELGFELVGEWSSFPRIGPFEWRDQVLPTDDLPSWLNEFEAEEAFHVYDHPTVFVFRKTENYDPERTQAILDTTIRQYQEVFGGFGSNALPVNRNVIQAPEVSAAPTALMMPEDVAEEQATSTWSDLFDTDAPFNQNHALAVLLWWGFMIFLGWVGFPFLFSAFAALPDRGYGVSKLVGLILVAWLAWVLGSLRIPAWTRDGIAASLLTIGVLSIYFGYRRRADLRAWLRENRRYVLAIEALTGFLFLAFLYVRLLNPDLWHNLFGGEKPMDFAYFNAILRSRVFPPLDPWFAGGYINYYYWGWVLVGAPVKLLGIVPALAYNLIIPTLFAMTGIGAFSVAYNLVARTEHTTAPRANPWTAGLAALLLVTVVGNLDTARLFVTEVARVGGFPGYEAYDLTVERRTELVNAFRDANGRLPEGEELQDILDIAQNPPPTAEFQYQVAQWADLAGNFVTGLDAILNDGAQLQMPTHRWYWAPTRIIAELPDGRGHNAINEMPYFTFLYGDLHAHMISMPIMLLVMLWIVAEIRGAGHGLRRWPGAGFALFLGGLSVGLLRATNTWDFPTFLILGVAGLGYATWAAQNQRRVDDALPQPPVFERLRGFLDLQGVQRLWPLLFLMPIGALAHAVYFVAQDAAYEADLEAGLIPIACQNITSEAPFVPGCEPFLKPTYNLIDAGIWSLAGLGGALMLYVVALVLLGARFDRQATLDGLLRLGGFVGFALITVWPFTAWYAGEAGLEPWRLDRTPLWVYLDIHGLFLFILFSALLWQSVRVLKRFRVADLRGLGVPALIVLLAVPLSLVAGLVVGLTSVPMMTVALPMLIWVSALFLIPGTSHIERGVYAMVALALGITMGVELVVVDVDIGRQNMVFKFYMQAWLLFGVAGGVALAWLLHVAWRWNPLVQVVWSFGFVLLLTIALMYPIMATQARWQDRFNAEATGVTLDGLAYMQQAVYGDNSIWFNTIGDYRMINWLNENIAGTPTIIEAQAVEYRWGARIANNTGLPTVIGWNWHQRQQRSVLDLNQVVWTRSNNVSAFYTAPDIETAWNLIEFYDIEYIIVGVYERVVYDDLRQDPISGNLTEQGLSAGLAKFERMAELGLLDVVYEARTCVAQTPIPPEDCDPQNLVTDRIYRVVPGADYRVEAAQR
ncbi:MAG: DUF2298 domain-containing protein, partial [Anaerolineales bacterium]